MQLETQKSGAAFEIKAKAKGGRQCTWRTHKKVSDREIEMLRVVFCIW
jgi:hypothetical protein